jgi:hypothetical protein
MPEPSPTLPANDPVGQPTATCKLLHWISVRLLKLPYLKEQPDWWRPSGLAGWFYRESKVYPSEPFQADLTDGAHDGQTGSDGSAEYTDIPYGNCNFKFNSFYVDIEKFLHPVPLDNDPGTLLAPAKAHASSPIISVDLLVLKNTLTLKHDNQSKLEIIVRPPQIPVDEYRIEIKRESGGPWCTLSKTAVLDPFVARIAGRFKLRGVAKIYAEELFSAEKDLIVQFPTYSQIVKDSAVQAAADDMWRKTLNDCTLNPNRRRELGMWIPLNTTSDEYEFREVPPGDWSGPDQNAAILLGLRPDDVPAKPQPNAAGATYIVASFHSHTSPEYRGVAFPGLNAYAGVGPSRSDDHNSVHRDCPGLVYDYESSPPGICKIPVGHPKTSQAKIYPSPSNTETRRSTPP